MLHLLDSVLVLPLSSLLLNTVSVLITLMFLFHRECILCRAFSQGLNPNECETRCAHLNLTLVGQAGVLATVLSSPDLHRCKEVDTKGCRVHFLLRTGQKDAIQVHVALERGKQTRVAFLWLHQYINTVQSILSVTAALGTFFCVEIDLLYIIIMNH